MYFRKEINYEMRFEEVKGFENSRDILVPQINSKNTHTLKNADGEFLMQGFWEKHFLKWFRGKYTSKILICHWNLIFSKF